MLRQVGRHPAPQARRGKLEKILIGRDIVFPTPLAPWKANDPTARTVKR